MPKLQGKVALVTGGSSGMGLATAKRFVEEGAFVYISGRRQMELDKAVSLIGRSVAGVQGDVSKLADLDRLYARIASEKGKIDILFAGAGIVDPQPLAETTEESFDKVFAINTRGLAFTVKKALPLLNDGGAIIVITSIAENKGIPGFTAYSATKAAVRSFVRTWTAELKDRRTSTTLADLFTQLLFADFSSAVRASLRPWSNDEFDDGVTYGRQARLRRWTVDSFFSAPLVRDGGAGGTRKRSWS
jgi:NAD(P)-dependent dehydrogenase (short-subunit alcohol dehydrogenase family)